ncbi:MAG: cytochrome b N-terminal domain-containing protein [Deltaproteobacteria bacterium]|nr:cytochrome b N-terminal domain-containing protein [Deltaproteobacteria bacterium]
MTANAAGNATRRGSSWQLGRLSMGMLAVTVLSGIALVPLYSPSQPLASLEAIESGIRWAWLLRALHWFSALGLLVLTLAHLVEVLLIKADQRLTRGKWWRALLLAPVVVLAMLSGFVLQGTADATAALAIWRSVGSSVPAIGPELSQLFLGPAPTDLSTVAIHHCATLTLIIVLLSAEHARRLVADARALTLTALATLGLSAVIAVPLGPAEAPTDGTFLLGPWYLLGLQGALRLWPVVVGWLAPLVVLAPLAALPIAQPSQRRVLLLAALAITLAYLGLSIHLLLIAQGWLG